MHVHGSLDMLGLGVCLVGTVRSGAVNSVFTGCYNVDHMISCGECHHITSRYDVYKHGNGPWAT